MEQRINCELAHARGLCKKSDCCGLVPMPAALYEENKGLAQKPLKELVSFGGQINP